MQIFKISICLLFFACTGKKESKKTDLSRCIEKKEKVLFLNSQEGAVHILDETYEPYFSVLQAREIHALTGEKPPGESIEQIRKFARRKFSAAVINFNQNEKNAISFAIQIIEQKLNEQQLHVITKQPWKFIKIKDWLCGGFAHTRGEYIILSERHLKHLTTNWSNHMTSKDSTEVITMLGSLLVHEQFHSLQRKFPEKFESLYTKAWGFKKAIIETDSLVNVHQLTNPDAPKAEWIMEVNNTPRWIRTLIDSNSQDPKMGRDFIDVVFTLESSNTHYRILKDSLNNNVKTRLKNYQSYTKLFPIDQGLDHPNEISAYMFSNYFKALLLDEKPFINVPDCSKAYSNLYVSWLKNNF